MFRTYKGVCLRILKITRQYIDNEIKNISIEIFLMLILQAS